MVGRKLAQYEVTQELGRGGMGAVYLARDTHLQRAVAIKVLLPDLAHREERRRRFIQEARAVARLNHPNIVTIYEVGSCDGVDFIAMEYVQGQTLRKLLQVGPLGISEACHFAVQIADALATAHAAGIVHRDLKPSNIIVSGDGLLKVVDFGLAKVLRTENPAAETRTLLETQEGTIAGTAAYMSPEQAQGLEVDHRSDIFSLGIILYEMLCGAAPFGGPTIISVLVAISSIAPDLTGIPATIRNIVDRALDKCPSNRYQSAHDLAEDLRAACGPASVGAGGPPIDMWGGSHEPAIAVLPFANLSSDPHDEYFSDGLTDEIINALSRVIGLRVVARTSAFQFKGKSQDITSIGARLRADAILEGTVRRAAGRLRITAQLISVNQGYHLWSERYDFEMRDIFDVQDEISRSIVATVKGRLHTSGRSGVTRTHAPSLETYQLYLKGNYHWHKQFIHKAVACFEAALEQDQGYAAAWVGLANCYVMLAHIMPARDMFARAKDAAVHALALDATSAEAHSVLGAVYALCDLRWSEADMEFRSAIALNAGSALVHSGYAMSCLAPRGGLSDAVHEMETALEIDPLSPFITHGLATCLYFAGDSERALQFGQQALDLDPQFTLALLLLGRIYLAAGKSDEALQSMRRAVAVEADLSFAWAGLCFCLGRTGGTGEASHILDTLMAKSAQGYVSSFAIAIAWLAVGSIDIALDWLGKAIDERAGGIQFLGVEPMFAPLRSHPGFQSLTRKLGLRADVGNP